MYGFISSAHKCGTDFLEHMRGQIYDIQDNTQQPKNTGARGKGI